MRGACDAREPDEDWDRAAAWLSERIQPGDRIEPLPSWSEAAPARLVKYAAALERAPIDSAPPTSATLWSIGPTSLIDAATRTHVVGSIAVARRSIDPVWRAIERPNITLILPDGSERSCDVRGTAAWVCPKVLDQAVRIESAERSFRDGARTCLTFDAPIGGARVRLSFPLEPPRKAGAPRALALRAGLTLRGARNHPTAPGVAWSVSSGGRRIAERSPGPMHTSWDEVAIKADSAADAIDFEARSLGPKEKTMCVAAWQEAN